MAIIAVAGGTGSVGQTIVEALVAHGKHTILILTRKVSQSSLGSGRWVDELTYLSVDYGNVGATAKSLEAAEVHTVICAFGMESDAISEAQVNLIHAADMSGSTKRFVVGGYDMLFKDEHIPLVPTAKWALAATHAVEESSLEYTRVVNGLFLDYYGLPHWRSHLKPWVNAVNVAGKWAVLPGDGTSKVNFITSQDMARFVARLMDLSEWPPVSFIAGQTASFKDILQLAENARGERFSVKHDSLEDLRNGRISFPKFEETGLESSGHSTESIFALFHYISGTGGYTITSNDTLDTRFPDIQIMTAAEVIESSWRNR
ncbi:hypothetical protein ANOM_005363 [Aspergillus nomiae NRRL 13137]|uniref:NmrA-like domain-containing protein n=1 Tax=Aspergillus nomiae NRRL (strain ATCC 15546 / NRRL 13137 / CBS 260.88 / M93) TaxID=1509407 RepID=A0A0L1J5J7_ASPN3|nr:uncharacterized protein ANOM_005363 [Aspergillus nomiae NRRL 13137]KNG86930.1 hypothetical protein ANOM_005363 [Aspergillus nomiae NRRL 13137]